MKKKIKDEAESHGLSQEYWKSLSTVDKELYRLVRPMRRSSYQVNVHLHQIENQLNYFKESADEQGGTFDLCPDFQRGHVWDDERRERYVEALLRGVAPIVIKFNSPSINGSLAKAAGEIHPYDFVCVDGLQRLTAVRKFMAGEIKAFGLTAAELQGTSFGPLRYTLVWEVFDIRTRRDLLQLYLDLNAGGVVHTQEELEKVRKLLEKA